jgi:hypothetical protein
VARPDGPPDGIPPDGGSLPRAVRFEYEISQPGPHQGHDAIAYGTLTGLAETGPGTYRADATIEQIECLPCDLLTGIDPGAGTATFTILVPGGGGEGEL